MNCPINQDRYKKLLSIVTKTLEDRSNKGQPFDMKSYSRDLYNFVLKGKANDDILATNYVMALPSAIIEIQHVNNKVRDYVLDSYPAIVRLEKSFKDFNNTIDYLGLTKNVISQIKKIQEIVNKTPEVIIPKEITNSKFDSIREAAKPYNPSTTTGQEAKVEIDPVTGKKTWTNIPDPDKAIYYKVLRSVLDKIISPSINGDSSKLNLPGSGGSIYLTAMSAGKIPNEHLYEETKQWLNELGISQEEKTSRLNRHEKLGVVLAITSEDSSLLHFNDKSEITLYGEGKPIYYMMRGTNEKGGLTNLDALQNNSQTAKSLSKQFGRSISLEEAKEWTDARIKDIHNIRQFIVKDPENNTIKSIITGGSKGLVDSHPSIKTAFSKLNFEMDHPFDPIFQETKEGPFYKTSVYFYYPGIDTPILLQRKEFTPDLANKVASLLIDDIKTKAPDGEIVSLSLYDKLRFAKNYIQTTSEGISIEPSEDTKTLDILIKGEKLDITDKESAKKILSEYLTRFTPNEIVSEPGDIKNVIDGSQPNWEEGLRQGSIVKNIDKDGKEVYTKYRAAQININRKFLNRMEDFQDFSIDNQAGNIMLTPTDKNFKEFLGENTYINVKTNEEGKIVTLNGYFNYSPLDEEIEKTIPKETQVQPEVDLRESKKVDPSIADERQKDIDDLLNTINKTSGQKLTNRQVTSDQLDNARLWYSKSPLSKYFPFETMFNMVNTANPKAIATWTIQGVTLYSGADYTDLYHEAWHGFTQGFLTKDQKTSLYNELRKRSGSFTTYEGKNTTFKSANNLELEEFLAEDFRSYVLSGGKSTTTPVRNSIFRRILNFFKALFGDSTISQLSVNDKSVATINDLYEKLRVGDINEYSFSAENVNYHILNKGLEALSKEEPIQSLSYEDSRLIVDTIDSLFSEVIDLKNNKESTNRFTTSITTSIKGRVGAYKYVQLKLSHLRNDLAKSIEGVPEGLSRTQIQKNIDLIDYTLRNFGDVENPTSSGKGVIGYHNMKSKYLSFEDKYMEIAPDEDDGSTKGREGYNRNGNENSLTELASNETLYLIRSLNSVDENGEYRKNRLGINQLGDFNIVWNRLAKVLEGSLSPQMMYNRIKLESDTFPIFKQLLSKLGPVDTISGSEFNMWTSFWNDFNKTRIPLIQMTLDRTDTDGKIIYTAKIGEASTDYKKAGQAWDNIFQTTYSNSYIKKDKNNINYLDIPSVLKDFPASTVKDNAFKFFQAIGIKLSDKKEIKQGILNDIGKANVIRAALVNIQQRGIIINKATDIFRLQAPTLQGISELRGEAGNLKKLMELETRYSDQYSNFSVTNAEGNPQFEHSLNSTLTQIVNTINSVKSFNELIEIPYMNHLDPDRNPYIKSSIWINSIFDMNSPGRSKRKDVKFSLENLSGVQLTKEGEFGSDGVSSASADEFTKFLLDFHTMILRGTPEFMRNADKGTSLTASINKVIAPGNKGGKLYIDTEQFIADPIKAQANLNNIVIRYIGSELSRIQTMNNASELDPIRNISDYYKNGKEFQLFDDVLSNSTKSKLKDLKIPLDIYLNTNTPESIKLRQNLESDIKEYFDSINNKANDRFNKTRFTADNLISTIKNESRLTDYASRIQKATNPNIIEGVISSFVVNSWIHNVETMNMFYGDIALYNMSKEEFHKRNAGLISTGTIYRSDKDAIRYINEVIGFGYAKEKGITQDKFGSILNSAVLEDTNTTSVYYNNYKSAIEKDIRDRYYKRKDYLNKGITKENLDKEISEAVNKAMEPYQGMKTGDAQGWITFDSLRIIKTLDNSWTPDHENIYQKMIKGENTPTSDITKFFPVQKLQYWGPLHTEGLPVIAFHKFSVFPLIPSVIKGTNLEKLHDKMMNENIHYALFKSGSKISTITNQGVTNPFYSDEKTKVLSQDKLTKNPIFLQYLKNQLETAPEFKEKITFSTQLRKLIEDGLIENGKFINDKAEKLVKTYEGNIRKLTEVKKKELLKEAGWVLDKNSNPKGDMKPLLAFVRKELTRQDLADHQIDFIDIKGNTNQLKHDLSISLSADKIERLLTAIVNKRLIRQKVNGEGLIQVSGAGFERLDAFTPDRNLTKPTEGDLKKWGSNDLPTYHPGPDGKTRAMKVKIALQGQFEKLLQLPELRTAFQENLTPSEKLNQLIKDEVWLNTGNNRQMITMIGVRIPVQGLNSMEFMEVYEFLPKEAGNIIVAPDEIVAKSGSDFDIDKLTVMMPNFRKDINSKISLSTTYSEKEGRALYDKVKTRKIRIAELKDTNGTIVWANDQAVDKLLTDIFGNLWDREYTQEEINDILKESNLQSFEDFMEGLNGSKSTENELLNNMREILELKENYSTLIRPNGTDIVKPIADELQSQVQEYNPKSRVHDGDISNVSPTRVLESEYNLYKHQSNNVGKQTLGLGAVDNSYNVVFNRIGAHLNSTYDKKMTNGKIQERSINLYLPHNTMNINDKKVISISNILDANNQYRISDIISQLMNGWVDVAKDAWIFNIQGNKEVAPVLLFMIQAGVPFEHAVYFVSQPLVREYINQQRLAKSTFADPLGKAPFHPNFFRRKAKETILLNPKFGFNVTESQLRGRAMDQTIYNLTREMTSQYKDSAFDKNNLKNSVGLKDTFGPEQQTAFLHYLELEDISRSIRDIKLRMNFDTSKSTTLFEAHNRKLQVEQLKSDGKIPTSLIENILTNSPIGSFNIQDFMINLWNPMFNLRNNKVVEDFVINKFREGIQDDIESTFDDPEKFVTEFKNDLVSFIFQNSVKAFNLNNIKNYKGFSIESNIPVESVKSLKNGVFVKDNILYVDKNQLQKDYIIKAWNNTSNLRDHITNYDLHRGLATINVNAFSTSKEYYNFVFEREYLRSIYDSEKVKSNIDYLSLLKKNIEDKKIIKLNNETDEAHDLRLKKISYEQFLRDQALDNTFNSWKMFSSDTSYAEQFNRISDSHPELKNDYLLLRILGLSVSKQGLKNLYSLDSQLDSDKLNTLHENLLNLSNSSVIKSNDPVENQRISDFFKKFPFYAFMQSGLTSTGKFSLTPFVPVDLFTRVMEEPVKVYSENMNNVLLELFYKRFKNLNNVNSKQNRFRHKDYIIQESLGQTVSESKNRKKISEETITRIPITDTVVEGIKEFSSIDYSEKSIINMVASNPESVFVYGRTLDPNKKGSETTNGVIQKAQIGFTLGIPTKISYMESKEKTPMTSINNALTDTTLDENKRLIDVAIQQLLDYKSQGRDIVFDKNGYGQGMIGRSMRGVLIEIPGKIIPKPGQQTFLYLSEQLYKNFNYINNNYLLQPEGREIVQKDQPVNDNEVREFIKNCINF